MEATPGNRGEFLRSIYFVKFGELVCKGASKRKATDSCEQQQLQLHQIVKAALEVQTILVAVLKLSGSSQKLFFVAK